MNKKVYIVLNNNEEGTNAIYNVCSSLIDAKLIVADLVLYNGETGEGLSIFEADVRGTVGVEQADE